MERADLHVLSSLHEAGPLVVFEAALAGIPTVGTRVGHVAEWDDVAASAVTPGDAPGLGAAIEALLGDETRRQRMARIAQARAVAEDADYTAARFLALYKEVTH
jgi:glycosyltransferase involved in cell wall biosynthesis